MGVDLNRFRKNRPSEWVEWLSDDPLPAPSRPAITVQPQVHRPQTYYPQVTTPVPQRYPGTPRSSTAPPGIAQPIQPVVPAAQMPPPRVTPAVRRPVESFSRGGASTPVAPPATNHAPATAGVSIQISMPKIKLPALPYKKIGIIAAGGALFIGIAAGGWAVFKHYGSDDQMAVKGAVSSAPAFDPLVPKDKPQLGDGNGTAENTAYDPQRGLYAFKDNLMGFGVTVSQQVLPENLKKNPGELKKVAESMGGAVSSVETAFGQAYISTADKGEAQRVVFIFRDILVLMNSYKTFDNDTWKYYIETLRQ